MYEAYANKFVQMYQTGPWKHAIIRKQFYEKLIEDPDFEEAGISCECNCGNFNSIHVHTIARYNKSTATLGRVAQQIKEDNGWPSLQGSAFWYKFLKIKNFNHYLATFNYVTKIIKKHRKGGDGRYEKHYNFKPFGNTRYAKNEKKGGGRRLEDEHWDMLREAIIKFGYKKEIDQAKMELQEYRMQRIARLNTKVQRFGSTYGNVFKPTTGGDISAKRRTAALQRRTGKDYLDLRNKFVDGTLLPSEVSIRDRIALTRMGSFGLLEKYELAIDPNDMVWFANMQGDKETIINAMWRIQQRKELPSTHVDNPRIGNGDGGQNGQCEPSCVCLRCRGKNCDPTGGAPIYSRQCRNDETPNGGSTDVVQSEEYDSIHL